MYDRDLERTFWLKCCGAIVRRMLREDRPSLLELAADHTAEMKALAKYIGKTLDGWPTETWMDHADMELAIPYVLAASAAAPPPPPPPQAKPVTPPAAPQSIPLAPAMLFEGRAA